MLARHHARHADGCERRGCVGSRLGAVRCALAPVRVSWSGVRRPRCGPERPRCGKGAGVVMLDHTGGTVCSGTPHCTRGSARTCLHAYVLRPRACRIFGGGCVQNSGSLSSHVMFLGVLSMPRLIEIEWWWLFSLNQSSEKVGLTYHRL
jgi:hypothetical protein